MDRVFEIGIRRRSYQAIGKSTIYKLCDGNFERGIVGSSVLGRRFAGPQAQSGPSALSDVKGAMSSDSGNIVRHLGWRILGEGDGRKTNRLKDASRLIIPYMAYSFGRPTQSQMRFLFQSLLIRG